MSAAFDKLRAKLSELFQLDAAAELDFGIYRILNARRVEVEGFLDSLEPQVEKILAETLQTGTSDLRAELEKVEAGLRAGGIDEDMIATAPKVKELRGRIATSGSDPTALTQDIFSHLTTFFSRYYKDGDFLSLRRYKKDTYAIPYEGEEVKLHWANADQYYIKSAENFRDYTFKLSAAGDAPRVTFKLVEADTQKDNTKATAGQERRFVYQGVIESDDPGHLILGFAYLPLGKDKKQPDLNKQAIEAILTEAAKGTFVSLAAPDKTYTGKKKEGRTLLEKHLTDYTARNTFDYFIHKDLGGFLRRELDFYIKNEVLHLDDLDDAPETNWQETRARLKALRTIATKVIRFLAQIEDFQKKLWLKKKFVIACDYVVTLDRIPEELYPEIAACDAQREEWVRLFAIDEIKGDLGRAGYSVPLTVEFLKENQALMVDTRWLVDDTRRALLRSSMALSESLVIFGENTSAARMVLNHNSSGPANAVYLDPPYNTGKDGFAYKDSFQHSSWLSMIAATVQTAVSFAKLDGVVFTSIDDVEHPFLRSIFDFTLGRENKLGTIIWKGATDNNPTRIAAEHEYVLCYGRNASEVSTVWENPTDSTKTLMLEKYESIKAKGLSVMAIQQEFRGWIKENRDSLQPLTHYDRIDEDGPYTGGRKVHNPGKEGYRYDIIHPTTKKPCKEPARGYRFPESRMKELLAKEKVLFGEDHTQIIQIKEYLKDYSGSMKSWFELDSRTAANTLESLFASREIFKNPKPSGLVEYLLSFTIGKDGTAADIFAGSGTTGHAVINLNREDGGDRKYILIEMGEHFDTVLVPRLKKVIYSKDWKDGKPQSRNTGISHCFKVLRLESYEDTLNNLRLHRTRAQELALESMTDLAREDYQLGYMLDLEASGSQSLLNVSAFTDPWNYTLEIASGSAGETRTTKVDLVETFNWLLGLTVLAQGHGGGVAWVEGTNPEGEKVLVLWRNTTEVAADDLNAWCKKQKVSVLDGEFDLIYVNGDHHLENLRRADQTWKVRLTDEEFPKLMWEGCE